jgi:SAM-dependent methyltransferase
MQDIFEHIYRNALWGGGSGEGSRRAHVGPYLKYLKKLIEIKGIRSVLDFGCGDWEFSRRFAWNNIDYHGFDVVREVIARNRAQFASAHVKFDLTPDDFGLLPKADLLVVKDVLQHWRHDEILRFLPVLARYPYALVTNCVGLPGDKINDDIKTGEFRPLDIRLPPFNVAASEVLCFTNRRFFFQPVRWVKKALLIDHSRAWEARQ